MHWSSQQPIWWTSLVRCRSLSLSLSLWRSLSLSVACCPQLSISAASAVSRRQLCYWAPEWRLLLIRNCLWVHAMLESEREREQLVITVRSRVKGGKWRVWADCGHTSGSILRVQLSLMTTYCCPITSRKHNVSVMCQRGNAMISDPIGLWGV